MASFEVRMDSLDEQQSRVEKMTKRAKDLSKPLSEATTELHAMIAESFSRQQGPLGQRWKGLDPDTKSKSKPLEGLAQSVRTSSGKKSISFGVAGPRALAASVQQFGAAKSGRKGRSKIPARPFLPLDASGKPSFTSGRAKEWMTRLRAAAIRWILRGE